MTNDSDCLQHGQRKVFEPTPILHAFFDTVHKRFMPASPNDQNQMKLHTKYNDTVNSRLSKTSSVSCGNPRSRSLGNIPQLTVFSIVSFCLLSLTHEDCKLCRLIIVSSLHIHHVHNTAHTRLHILKISCPPVHLLIYTIILIEDLMNSQWHGNTQVTHNS